MIRKLKIVLLLSIIWLGSTCTLKPVKVTDTEMAKATKSTLDQLHVADNKKELKINLRQAIALALQNNLEYRVSKIQAALAYKQFDLAKTELYPNLDISYAYDHRNRDYVKTLTETTGDDSSTQSLLPHTIKTGNVIFNWDALDFGLSYVRAQQSGDRYLSLLEQRKQMASRIINDVIKNYTLAYYGQELVDQIEDIEDMVTDALAKSDIAINQEVGERQLLLEYRKTLVEDFREAKDNLVYFNQSRDKLLNLIGYSSNAKLEDAPLVLSKPEQYLVKLPVVDTHLLYLDTLALYLRPELAEGQYKIKETEKQKTVVVLEKLPSFGFNLGYNYDSDKFLKHQSWWSDNISIAWNILQLASIPAARDTVEMQLETTKLTQLASSAVILGEVRVLLYNYKMKKYDFHLAEKQSDYAGDIYEHSLGLVSSGMGDEQVLVRDKLETINAELSKLRTFVDARNLFEDLILALGLYHSGGEFVNKSYVDSDVINKWIDRLNAESIDDIIDTEYSNIVAMYGLEDGEEAHLQGHGSQKNKPEKGHKNKKPSHGESKEKEHHAELKLNMPEKNYYYKLADGIRSHLAKLFGNTV